MIPILLLVFFFHLADASIPQKPLTSQNQHGPSIASATENANLLFNAIYSSMRQWGSSVQHNGMSFFPASIPEGTLLYHGSAVPDRPIGLEWLAFEIPHAEMFSVGFRRIRNRTDGGRSSESAENHVEFLDPRNMSPQYLWALEEPPNYERVPGYLQIYQVNRPLKVLYLDGMAAAKCSRGTLDSQDLLLLNLTKGDFAERERAEGLCALGEKWGVEGFIRMECGFELIKCDFSDGLDVISHKLRPNLDEPAGWNDIFLLDFVRDIANRYQGIDGGRVHLDYSSMVSAYFYPANLSNPAEDPGQWKLPRLVASEEEVLRRIKSDVELAVKDWKPTVGVDWQGVADMIVKRYSARLQWMASGMPQRTFLLQTNMLINTFIDYGVSESQDPVTVCSEHYLQPVQLVTETDRLLEAGFKTVTRRICSTIFEVRRSLLEKQKDDNINEDDDVSAEMELIRDLTTWLDWSDWKTCGQCELDEVCLIAIFPFGTVEDHYQYVSLVSFLRSRFVLKVVRRFVLSSPPSMISVLLNISV
ncbi:hypothetical protein D0Z07_7971 [Hyphodiscus hymeniophilus]|uniref:Uncharacterized protein n=1 Tax=Hyphodiscus hymeniophilus TaxID=353542 RepID=A0A9P6SQZ0_9HELO|nr:hypothetical protein D0Z07_7971 [Hyphodiscus hymeniophilus]